MTLTAVVDANALAPNRLRNVILTLADAKQFTPVWSDMLIEELSRSLLGPRFRRSDREVSRLIGALERTFPLARAPIDSVLSTVPTLPDAGDRHVVAAAIARRATHIVTFNRRHFPRTVLQPLGIIAVRPDTFLNHLLASNSDAVIQALTKRATLLKNPTRTVAEMITDIAPQAPTFVRACLDLLGKVDLQG